jgi:hypothetical protein
VPDTATTVTTMLAAAGIAPGPDDVEAIIAGYPAYRAGADALFAVDGLADVAPLTAFSLAPLAPAP